MKQENGIFTNNKWIAGKGITFQSFNPANNQMIWQGQEANVDQIQNVIENASHAFENWSTLTIDQRSEYLVRYGEELRTNSQHLSEIISKETGKPLWDSRNEVSSMINKIEISLEAYGRRCAGMIREYPSSKSITRHKAHGVVAVFGPFNFPGHLPGGHIIPALLAGNTVVFKPSELTPLVGEEMANLWKKVNLPPAVFNLVQGGKDVGQTLIHHPKIQGLFFTGSYQTGLYLSNYFGNYPQKILALELGGNNPLIVSEISDLKTAAYLTIQSAFLTSGQRCTCARRLILPRHSQTEEFVHLLCEKIQEIIIGFYTDKPEPFMGPVISEKHAKQLLEKQTNLLNKGAIPLLKMESLQKGAAFLSPALLDVTAVHDRPDEEIFGPCLQLIYVKDFQSAIEEANRTQFGLSAGLFSDNPDEYAIFYKQIRAGIINWNNPLTGASSAAPFGGIGGSGNHRPSAYYAADYCSYPVASIESPSLKMPRTEQIGFRKIVD